MRTGHPSGARLREERKLTGMSQTEASVRCGLSKRAFVNLEAGHRPSVATALAVARLFRRSVEDLFGDEEPTGGPPQARMAERKNGRSVRNDLTEMSRTMEFDQAEDPSFGRDRNEPGRSLASVVVARIVVRGTIDPESGEVPGFERIDEIFRPIGIELAACPFGRMPDGTTATRANWARWIHRRMRPKLPMLHSVRIRQGRSGDVAVHPVSG